METDSKNQINQYVALFCDPAEFVNYGRGPKRHENARLWRVVIAPFVTAHEKTFTEVYVLAANAHNAEMVAMLWCAGDGKEADIHYEDGTEMIGPYVISCEMISLYVWGVPSLSVSKPRDRT